MIELGIHTDNWRPLSVGFEGAIDKIAGIGSSAVPVGGGVNADNIKACLALLHRTGWNGVVSIECHGSDENTMASVEWMRARVAELP
jgi:hypothetical protein